MQPSEQEKIVSALLKNPLNTTFVKRANEYYDRLVTNTYSRFGEAIDAANLQEAENHLLGLKTTGKMPEIYYNTSIVEDNGKFYTQRIRPSNIHSMFLPDDPLQERKSVLPERLKLLGEENRDKLEADILAMLKPLEDAHVKLEADTKKKLGLAALATYMDEKRAGSLKELEGDYLVEFIKKAQENYDEYFKPDLEKEANRLYIARSRIYTLINNHLWTAGALLQRFEDKSNNIAKPLNLSQGSLGLSGMKNEEVDSFYAAGNSIDGLSDCIVENIKISLQSEITDYLAKTKEQMQAHNKAIIDEIVEKAKAEYNRKHPDKQRQYGQLKLEGEPAPNLTKGLELYYDDTLSVASDSSLGRYSYVSDASSQAIDSPTPEKRKGVLFSEGAKYIVDSAATRIKPPALPKEAPRAVEIKENTRRGPKA